MDELHQPRCPQGIRRHYDQDEASCTNILTPGESSDILKRPNRGTAMKQDRLHGRAVDNPNRVHDGSWKYEAQEISKTTAHRDGSPWNRWESDYLLRAADREDLLRKAQRLGRTYRACESRRRDLLRLLDERTTP